jgi:hypothetical protein
MRRVMIATPAYDGRVDVYFADSLVETIKLSAKYDVEICPIYMPNDALIQRSRNDLVKIAVDAGFDDMIWIDSDQQWKPEWVFKLLSYPVDVVGGAVRKKSDVEQYNIRANDAQIIQDETTGLLIVDGIGTGFLRLSRRAFTALWESSAKYLNHGRDGRMVFDVQIVDGQLVSEDNVVCNKLKALGFHLCVDQNMTCSHLGTKKWDGDFAAWLEKLM